MSISTGKSTNYYWVRIYDYNVERDGYDKGTMLDEFYLKDVEGGREEAKKQVLARYTPTAGKDLKFAKPRKKDGIYAILMDSEKFFYERFYTTVDTLCFWCHQPVKGKASEFPRDYIGEGSFYESGDSAFTDLEKTAYFCSFEHKYEFGRVKRQIEAGEFQEKEQGKNGNVFGYIYLIYNRMENTYYIGQTRYMPFFRWQEHVKDGSKGELSDLSFSVLAEVNSTHKSDEDQLYLNSMEAWWIEKYKAEGQAVFNISKPKITIAHLKEKFKEMVEKSENLFDFEAGSDEVERT